MHLAHAPSTGGPPPQSVIASEAQVTSQADSQHAGKAAHTMAQHDGWLHPGVAWLVKQLPALGPHAGPQSCVQVSSNRYVPSNSQSISSPPGVGKSPAVTMIR